MEFNHVTCRGNAQQAIYLDDIDYLTFLRMFAEAVARYAWRCHAYCLMPNHFHVLLETEHDTLAQGMHLLNGRYARRFNARHARVGHVFQGPYHAEPIQREEHYLEACRYIELNPVRAGLCSTPGEWPWSSYRAHAGLCERPGFLSDVSATFAPFGGYATFVAGGINDCNLVETRLRSPSRLLRVRSI